ncbi:MAG: hypothetical protein RQ899_03735 [Pseudomonadales bacterium]|nr:hypothetical protein [Pseudomonadales bacterium]
MNSKEMREISQAYVKNHEAWKHYLASFLDQITALLESADTRFSIKFRIKTLESLSEKISFLSKAGKEQEPQIKDLIGLRVVVPFQEGVERVVAVLCKNYAVEAIERKSDQLSYREFAYDSVHVEIPLTQELGLPGCCKPVVEVQVRTILQDAWAEVEHELIYKNHFRFPNSDAIRKKLAALNASLTLSDMIFQEIRDSQKEMEKWGHERFQALLDKTLELEGPGLPAALDIKDFQTSEQSSDTAAGSRAEMEKYLLAALKAHNEHDYKSAIAYYSMVLDRNPELSIRSVVFSHRGMANFMLQRESQALSDFDRSFYCDKSNYRALNYRAMVLRRMGYVEQALECFEMSLEIHPGQAGVHFLRSQTLLEIQETERALADLTRALELDPEHEEAQKLLDRISHQPWAKKPAADRQAPTE